MVRNVRCSPLSILLLAAIDALGAPMAHAQSQPSVEPIPAPSHGETGAPAAPQADDEETPRSHNRTETFNRTAPTDSESSQLAVGLALGVVAVLTAIKAGSASSGDRQLWYGAAVLVGGAAARVESSAPLASRGPTVTADVGPRSWVR
jgi:predicted cobalt transporter CbtA